MNRIFNSWIFIFAIVGLVYAFFASMYESFGIFHKVQSVIKDGQKEYVYITIAILIFAIGTWRSSKKWSGIRIIKQVQRYQFNTVISKKRKKQVLLNNFLETIAYLFFTIAYAVLDIDASILSLVFLIIIIDSLLNLTRGINGKKYRVGMTNRAIVTVDREVKVIYFKGLTQVTLQNGRLYFEYVNDLVLDLEMSNIPTEQHTEFINTLRTVVDETKVYFSGFGNQFSDIETQ